MLIANIDFVRVNEDPIDVIQNEDQDFLLLVEPGRNPFAVPITDLHIDFVDQDTPNKTVITISTISKLLENKDILVLQFSISNIETDQFIPGEIDMQVFMDSRKAQLMGAFTCIQKLH